MARQREAVDNSTHDARPLGECRRLTGVAIAVAAVAAAQAVFAFPDGAPWEAAGGEGCVQCHFDAPPAESSAAVAILGLPTAAAPGARYPLTIRLEDERLVNAGFLLSAWRGADGIGSLEAGRFDADDEKVATTGARARSTEAGSQPASPGVAEWSVVWQAPSSLDAPVVFELWANAGNGDKSPFGDATHRRVFQLGTGDATSTGRSDPAGGDGAYGGGPTRGDDAASARSNPSAGAAANAQRRTGYGERSPRTTE